MAGPYYNLNYLFLFIGYSMDFCDGWAEARKKNTPQQIHQHIKSLYGYYKLLMDAGKAHYKKMFEINKLSETNSLESLRQQQKFDIQKLNLIKTEYERYASSSYTVADKWDKMDEYAINNLIGIANMQLQNEIAKTKRNKIC